MSNTDIDNAGIEIESIETICILTTTSKEVYTYTNVVAIFSNCR